MCHGHDSAQAMNTEKTIELISYSVLLMSSWVCVIVVLVTVSYYSAMGKKKAITLGNAIIRNKHGGRGRQGQQSFLHTSEINDGYDWGRLNLQSVTEQSALDDFLNTAELAGTEFTAEKLNITVVSPNTGGLPSKEELASVIDTQNKYREHLNIPRRPRWDSTTTAEQLQTKEQDDFLNWRRNLAQLEEIQHLVVTPYEKNLDLWRQLWRVIERSDVVVQIVDARDPGLFRCEDLEKYVKEVDPEKVNMILVNKSDLLTQEQREQWANYYGEIGIIAAFWSATMQSENVKKSDPERSNSSDDENSNGDSETVESDTDTVPFDNLKILTTSENEDNPLTVKCDDSQSNFSQNRPDAANISNCVNEGEFVLDAANMNPLVNSEICAPDVSASVLEVAACKDSTSSKGQLLSREELLNLFRTIHTGKRVTTGLTVIGLVGYPNVGKSSTINTLLEDKKVAVSATPGKTKHFQTLYVDDALVLCDCPGLVMPTFVATKAHMILSGILPIDQMRDHVPPISLVCQNIPRFLLQTTYGIIIPKPEEGENEDRPPTAEELLNAYGYMRGFMTSQGRPDGPRSARLVLKDYVSGKLLYCQAPPGVEQEKYRVFHHIQATGQKLNKKSEHSHSKSKSKLVDESFFSQMDSKVHIKGAGLRKGPLQPSIGKPHRKHHNKNKKEKLRRVFGHLDQA